ncbi:molybdopterin-dependent oxidoreductase [Yinghuangia soli]|uniref:Molybdopterin-dependent oxidoreductase n=1 Tax=Yinghuangia soli TaxID=2908204 RepID=A0AA41PZW8_9ACTN|nr:molybdopterin-dependent oxidoreductase [Yinghuangia soli]MCF2528746.1 molybdopterin-dependent oxidoreductase [Yinghuangia soli]
MRAKREEAALGGCGRRAHRGRGMSRISVPRGHVPDIPLPEPPAALRRGPLREGAFRSALHDPRTAVVVGRLLGVSFAVCFLTGLLSHLMQHQPGWLAFPSRPVWGYRVSQGLHVATGIAAVPLLLVKLWVVYPRLFAWPPARSVRHALERLSIAVLVAAAIFELATGLINIVQWYPWPFAFVPVHYWIGWVATGALVLHIGVQLPVITEHWRRGPEVLPAASPSAAGDGSSADAPSRRGLLAVLGASVGVVTLATVGQTVSPLAKVSLLAPRKPGVGPQDLPVNRTAAAAAVLTPIRDPGWRLTVAGPRGFSLSRAELLAMPQHTVTLPIACVEGWSASASWTGVRIRDLMDRAGAPRDATLRVVSLELGSPYSVMEMRHDYTRDPLTLLALGLNGETLDEDHGYPARIIAPNRPGVLQTKWVDRMEVLT